MNASVFDYYVFDGTDEQKCVVDAAMFVVMEAGILKDFPKTSIDIEFVNTPGGGCIDMEDGEFTIEINKRLVTKSIIKTVIHEMVHVQQYVEGRLTQTEWMGRPHPDLPYKELPWEIEAFARERELYSHVTS